MSIQTMMTSHILRDELNQPGSNRSVGFAVNFLDFFGMGIQKFALDRLGLLHILRNLYSLYIYVLTINIVREAHWCLIYASAPNSCSD